MKMLSNRQIMPPAAPETNPLWISWHDTQMMPVLSPQTVMDYFCRKSNPFYDRLCNNEQIRMTRKSSEILANMQGVEYILLHVSEPVLYVIRKQHRHSTTEATPLADYYIIGGTVYKAPDLASVINSRVLSAVCNLQAAFEETSSYMRYHPNKGYSWDFSSNKALSDKSRASAKKEADKAQEVQGTHFQTSRVNMLLENLAFKFPMKTEILTNQQTPQTGMMLDNGESTHASSTVASNNGEFSPAAVGGIEPKQEPIDMKPPPEKKCKM